MKTTIAKKLLAVSAVVLSGLAFTSGASAQSFYENANYNNNTNSYANAGPNGATAYYTDNTSSNSTNYLNNGFGGYNNFGGYPIGGIGLGGCNNGCNTGWNNWNTIIDPCMNSFNSFRRHHRHF